MKKRILALVLGMAMMVACVGCGGEDSVGLFKNEDIVKFGDVYTHKVPADLEYDEKLQYKGQGFEELLESFVNEQAYPETMVYDEDGNITGMYDYDEETGLAKGITNVMDGSYQAFEKGKEVDLGKPDASKMIDIPGEVTVCAVVYGKEKKAVAAYLHFVLSEKGAKDVVASAVKDAFQAELKEESETVLTLTKDADAIAAEFKEMADAGFGMEDESAESYGELIKMNYNLVEYNGENPYKPYAGHKDPEDIDFDDRGVLCGAGSMMTAEEKYEANVKSMSCFVYAKNDVVVAEYTYYECESKEAAQELIDNQQLMGPNPELVDDTVVRTVIKGKEMEEHLTSYMGYSVLADKKLDTYVKMLEGTFLILIYE